MTGEELKATIINVGLTQIEFARLVGVDLATVKRWIAGTVPISKPVLLLARLLRSGTISPAQMAEARNAA